MSDGDDLPGLDIDPEFMHDKVWPDEEEVMVPDEFNESLPGEKEE
jgi:hypothetical protein